MEKYYGIIALVIYIICLIIFIRYEAKHEGEEEVEEVKQEVINEVKTSPLDLNDEDATVASLIAAIECRNEYKKNVQVISVRRIG